MGFIEIIICLVLSLLSPVRDHIFRAPAVCQSGIHLDKPSVLEGKGGVALFGY